MPSGFNLLVDILERDGPRTYRELQGYPRRERVDKNILTRAVDQGRINYAFIPEDRPDKESTKAVRLYYTDAKQLYSRKGVLVPLAQLKETEENIIRDYVKMFDGKIILLGNAQAELGFELMGDSQICVRRRDLLRRFARECGVEIKRGYDESIPPKGSMRWWESHRNRIVSEIAKILSQPLASYSFPDYEDYAGPISNWPRLQPGCSLGSILLPELTETSKTEGLSMSFKSLRHLEDKQQLETEFNRAVFDCRKGLELTRKSWKTFTDFVDQIGPVRTVDTKDHQFLKRRDRTACFLYVDTYTSWDWARSLDGGYENFPAPNLSAVASTIKKILQIQTDESDLIRTLRIKQGHLMEVIGKSIEPFDSSEKKLNEFLEKLRNRSSELSEKGLTDRCEECRGVTPGPQVEWPGR